MKFGLDEQTITKIQGVFKQFPAVKKAVIYGSRAKGNYKKGSDIDLTLFGKGLNQSLCGDIAEEIDELLLPYMVDLSVYDLLNEPDLVDHIQRVGQNFYESAEDAETMANNSQK